MLQDLDDWGSYERGRVGFWGKVSFMLCLSGKNKAEKRKSDHTTWVNFWESSSRVCTCSKLQAEPISSMTALLSPRSLSYCTDWLVSVGQEAPEELPNVAILSQRMGSTDKLGLDLLALLQLIRI